MSQTPADNPAETSNAIVVARSPHAQMGDLSDAELAALGEEYGLDPHDYRKKVDLVSAIHDRRQTIAGLDRDAMMDVLTWAGLSVPDNAGKDQIAIEIIQLRTMRFSGLSQRGLYALAKLRGARVEVDATSEQLLQALKRQEGLFKKLKRKTRSWFGKKVAGWMGETNEIALPPGDAPQQEPPKSTAEPAAGARPANTRQEIEDSGFFSGIANRVKRQADSYLNQKLDEIESRIDRKLDEIDRRLAEWRDKEIANRIRILKITLWASVIAAVVSLIYSYVYVTWKTWNRYPTIHPSTTHTQLMDPPASTPPMAALIAIHMSRKSSDS